MNWSTSYLAFVGLVSVAAVLRLFELQVSARRIRRRRERLVAEPWLFPLMVVLHTGLLATPLFEVQLLGRPFLPWLAATSGVALSLAMALRVWSIRSLRTAWNVRILRPEDDQIVVTGPYAWIRHPNYLAVILEVAALPLFHTAWLSALAFSALNAYVLRYRIRVEERTLDSIPAWREAMKDRPRLFPGLY